MKNIVKKVAFPFPDTPLCRAAAGLAGKISQNGRFRTFFVGGAVRDMLLGKMPHDIDIVTSANPDELLDILPEAKLVGQCFGVMLAEYGNFRFEVASAREERCYLDGRHPESVSYTRDLSLDVKRRDFTVNALLYDPFSEEIIDCTGGIDDLENRIIRTVGDAEERFGEDYLRMLRAVRFAARLDFAIAPETFDAMSKLAGLSAQISPERVGAELTMMMQCGHADRAFELLRQSGILKVLLPEAAEMYGVTQSPDYHPEGDVWTHTMIMLSMLRAPSAELVWSVLLHDTGKKAVRTVEPSGRIRFFTHEIRSAEIAGRVLRQLHFSNDMIKNVTAAIANHMRIASAPEMRREKLRKLIGAETFPLELELHRLDCFSSHKLMNVYLFLLDKISEQGGVTSLPEPFIRGADLIELGMKPGPDFSVWLKKYYDLQLAGAFSSPEEARNSLRSALARKQPKTAGR